MSLTRSLINKYISAMISKQKELGDIFERIESSKNQNVKFYLNVEHQLDNVFTQIVFINKILSYGNTIKSNYDNKSFEKLEVKYQLGKSILKTQLNLQNSQSNILQEFRTSFFIFHKSQLPTLHQNTVKSSTILLNYYIHRANHFKSEISNFNYNAIKSVHNANENINLLIDEFSSLSMEAKSLEVNLVKSDIEVYFNSGCSLDIIERSHKIAEWKLLKYKYKVSKVNERIDKFVVPHFDGDLSNWKHFALMFSNTVINCKEFDEKTKIKYLYELLGESEIQTIFINQKIEINNIEKAWTTLTKKYDKKINIIISIADKLFDLPLITFDNINNISKLTSKIKKSIDILSNMNVKITTFESLITRMLISKFDDKTIEEISEIKSCNTLILLLECLEKEMKCIKESSKTQCIIL